MTRDIKISSEHYLNVFFLQNVSNLIGAETLNIMTLVKMTFSITLKRFVEFRNLVHYAYCRYAKQGNPYLSGRLSTLDLLFTKGG